MSGNGCQRFPFTRSGDEYHAVDLIRKRLKIPDVLFYKSNDPVLVFVSQLLQARKILTTLAYKRVSTWLTTTTFVPVQLMAQVLEKIQGICPITSSNSYNTSLKWIKRQLNTTREESEYHDHDSLQAASLKWTFQQIQVHKISTHKYIRWFKHQAPYMITSQR